jgi:hypothetical protein
MLICDAAEKAVTGSSRLGASTHTVRCFARAK